jgi:hypothetical protein
MGFREDLRFAARLIRKNLGFSLVIVLVLGVGIGANTTVFTLVNAVLFRPLPFHEGHRIMYLTSNNVTEGRDNIGVSLPDFRDWRSQAKTFKGLAAVERLRREPQRRQRHPRALPGEPHDREQLRSDRAGA